MDKKPAVYFILLSGFLFSLSSLAQHKNRIDERRNRVIRLINALPEVQKADIEIRRKTQGQRSLTTLIDQEPDKHSSYYLITVSEYNGMNLVPHFKFFLDAKTNTIYYWDVLSDKRISLSQWRKQHYR